MNSDLIRHYIWINPVVLEMYGTENVNRRVCQAGYVTAAAKEDHIAQVKAAYRAAVGRSSTCVMDMRCPAAVDYVRKTYGDREICFPGIDPILISCAKELAKRFEKDQNADLTVITPCSELRDLGNSLNLPDTRFFTWLEFCEREGISLQRSQIEASPIPPGFFSDFGDRAISLASRKAIDDFFKPGTKEYQKWAIAEMLYCDHGCHNGNGV